MFTIPYKSLRRKKNFRLYLSVFELRVLDDTERERETERQREREKQK